MGSLRTIPGIVRGCSSDTRELSFSIPATAAGGVLGSLGCDALIEAVYFRGTGRPTVANSIRLYRMRANAQVQDEYTPQTTAVAITAGAGQYITDGFNLGAGVGLVIGNGIGASGTGTGTAGVPAGSSGAAGGGTGTGTGTLGNGLPRAPVTKALSQATLTTWTTGANSGFPRNNVIQATDQIAYAFFSTADGALASGGTGTIPTGMTNLTVTIRFREIDAAALVATDAANYIDG